MTFVFVHGSFHGGWCWQRVRELLADAGHQVFAPSLAGSGEHKHLLSPDIGLETYINDIVNLFKFEDLDRVILVGHSYGGMVITGVCEAVPERISHLVYLDALVPKDGQSAFDLMDAEIVALLRSLAVDGWRVEVPPDQFLSFLGIEDASIRAWMAPRFTPQSLKSFEEPFRASTGAAQRVRKTYIECTNPSSGKAYQTAAGYARENGWGYHALPTVHEAMWTMPGELAAILLRLGICVPTNRQPSLRRVKP